MAKNSKNKKKHLSDEERFCIEKMLGVEKSMVDIAKTLGRGKSTITEEVERNGGRKRYRAEAAIRRAYWKQYRKKRNCNKVACDGHLTRFIEKKLETHAKLSLNTSAILRLRNELTNTTMQIANLEIAALVRERLDHNPCAFFIQHRKFVFRTTVLNLELG